MTNFQITDKITLPIGRGQGTADDPFDLSVGEGFETIKHIDLNGCFASIPNPKKEFEQGYNSLVTMVDNKGGGGLTNTDLESCFQYASISAFTVNCPNLVSAEGMFTNAPLIIFDSNMPELEIGDNMFSQTMVGMKMKIDEEGYYILDPTSTNEANFFFPKLKSANYMFYWRFANAIDEETLKFKAPLLEEAEGMFYQNISTTRFELTTNTTMAENEADYFKLPTHNDKFRYIKTVEDAEDGLKKVIFDKTKRYSFTVTTEWMKQQHPAIDGHYTRERFRSFPAKSARDSDLTMFWDSVDEIVFNEKTPQEWLEFWANNDQCDAELCIWSGTNSPLYPDSYQPDQIITYKYNK